MQKLSYTWVFLFLLINVFQANASDNQTDTLSPVFPSGLLPFDVTIEQADFQLPNGIHSGVSAIYKDYWVFLAGRTNGLHGFGPTNNFPPQQQNTTVYVVNPRLKTIVTRSLNDESGLTQEQIDVLSVTSPQSYQCGKTLYMTGGYGIETSTGTFSTKPVLIAIDIPSLIEWARHPERSIHLANHIRYLVHPIFQITGGEMYESDGLTLLIFGQNFTGQYNPGSNGDYSEQVRRFRIRDDGKKLSIKILASEPLVADPNYRRRDLNVLPLLIPHDGHLKDGFVAYAGVFTLNGGVWTVPVTINSRGRSTMADPSDPFTFKQSMNQYVCAAVGLFSKKNQDYYSILFGGISYGFFQNGSFTTNNEIPFINQVTTIKRDKQGLFSQYLMNAEYPVILSTESHPGNPLLFGAGAYFMPRKIPTYDNGVLKLDKIKKSTVIGYIVGGIQSTLPNTNTMADSAASPYIFKVILHPQTND